MNLLGIIINKTALYLFLNVVAVIKEELSIRICRHGRITFLVSDAFYSIHLTPLLGTPMDHLLFHQTRVVSTLSHYEHFKGHVTMILNLRALTLLLIFNFLLSLN